jgi:hypothetical protein
MSRRELHRAVAQATGDSMNTVKRIGFILADPTLPILDPEDECYGPHVIDWDEYLADPLFKEHSLV